MSEQAFDKWAALDAEFKASLPAILAGHDPIMNTLDMLDGYVKLLADKFATAKPAPTVSNFSSAPSIATIKQVVADLAEVPIHSMTQDSRSMRFVIPRWVAIYIAHEVYAYPGSMIARRFNRDASTMFHAYREIKRRAPGNGEIQRLIGRAMKKLEAA